MAAVHNVMQNRMESGRPLAGDRLPRSLSTPSVLDLDITGELCHNRIQEKDLLGDNVAHQRGSFFLYWGWNVDVQRSRRSRSAFRPPLEGAADA